MRRFIIEREVEGASMLTQEQLAEIATTSNEAAASLGVPYHWVNTYVAGDKLYCVYIAPDADLIVEHARCGGFPVDSVNLVSTVIDPTTGE